MSYASCAASLPHVLTAILLFEWGPQAAAAVVCDSKSVLKIAFLDLKIAKFLPAAQPWWAAGCHESQGRGARETVTDPATQNF